MKKSESLDKIAPAIVAASAEVGNLFPAAKGHNYNYVPIEKLIDMIKPVCHKYGLAVLQGPTKTEKGVAVETMLLHVSGQFVHIESDITELEAKGMNRAQADGAAITYLRRYQLAALFCTAADEDVDANPGQPPQGPPDQKKAPKKEAMTEAEKKKLNDTMFKKAAEAMDEENRADWSALYAAHDTAEWKADVNYQIKIDKILSAMTPEARSVLDAENAACRNVEERKSLFDKLRGMA